MAKTVEYAAEQIKKIKAESETEYIKDYMISPLVNMKTCQDTGFCIQLQLNTKYDYDKELFERMVERFEADDWYISVKRSQLWVYIKVRY